ncbi:MAG: protoglobin family protein [Neomegalonema sp.]|nr:protoglobin family protein [Neomegalonema sp.]
MSVADPGSEADPSRPHDPHRGAGFEHFCTIYLPLIRPAGQLKRLLSAFEIGDGFADEFRGLRPVLRDAQKDWPDTIVRELLRVGAMRADFSLAEMEALRTLYRRHAQHFSAGNFNEAYLESLERVALMFLYADVRSVWLAGVYARLEEAVVDRIFAQSTLPGAAPLRPTMRAFSKAMTIELSQIQRVFICYERAVVSRAPT